MEWRPLPAGITGWYWRPQPGPDCSLLALLLVSGPGDAVDLFWCSQQCGHNAYSECLSGKQTTKTTNARQSGEASLVPTAFAPVGVSKSPELGSLACALPKVARGGGLPTQSAGPAGLGFPPPDFWEKDRRGAGSQGSDYSLAPAGWGEARATGLLRASAHRGRCCPLSGWQGPGRSVQSAAVGFALMHRV